jgi:hydrogenase maturation protease
MRVIGIGQRVAGDDGVGHAVVDALAASALPDDAELLHARDASELVELLQCAAPVVVVDAVVGAGAPGQVHVLDEQALSSAPLSGVSTHGMSVRQALELARLLHPAETSKEVCFVAVSIEAPRRYIEQLSPPVAEAVPCASERVLRLMKREVG